MRKLSVSIAICTWNRAKLLDQTLAALCKLIVPSGISWEILVVDNSSTDDTPSVIDQYSDRLPLHHLCEVKQGLSHARNCATVRPVKC